jgi:hypothetical protein
MQKLLGDKDEMLVYKEVSGLKRPSPTRYLNQEDWTNMLE